MLARFCYNRPMIEIFDTHTHLNVDNFAGTNRIPDRHGSL